jgi:hypothetical protein
MIFRPLLGVITRKHVLAHIDEMEDEPGLMCERSTMLRKVRTILHNQ